MAPKHRTAFVKSVSLLKIESLVLGGLLGGLEALQLQVSGLTPRVHEAVSAAIIFLVGLHIKPLTNVLAARLPVEGVTLLSTGMVGLQLLVSVIGLPSLWETVISCAIVALGAFGLGLQPFQGSGPKVARDVTPGVRVDTPASARPTATSVAGAGPTPTVVPKPPAAQEPAAPEPPAPAPPLPPRPSVIAPVPPPAPPLPPVAPSDPPAKA